MFTKPNTREETIRRIKGQGPPPGPIATRWTTGAGEEDVDQVVDGMDEVGLGESGQAGNAGGGVGGGKKKGKGKQLLFSVSARPS